MNYIKDAFTYICSEAKPAHAWYVSLYVVVPYYGGPEEGGWWGEDVNLVATQPFSTLEMAEIVEEKVNNYAKQLSQEAKREYGEHCLRQTEWLEARGLDDSFLSEVDGESRYFVSVEEKPGESESYGSRHYE